MTNRPGGSNFHAQYHWTNGMPYQPSYNQQFAPAPPKCRLCRSMSVQPTYLSCKHAFCYMCLRAYVERQQYTDSLDFPCPHCGKLSAPPWGIWHLSHKVVDKSHDEVYQTWKYEAMCDNCATEGLYATAGRHCDQCNISLCDTCSYAHSVGSATQGHVIKTLSTKNGNNWTKNQDLQAAEHTNSNQYTVYLWLVQYSPLKMMKMLGTACNNWQNAFLQWLTRSITSWFNKYYLTATKQHYTL